MARTKGSKNKAKVKEVKQMTTKVKEIEPMPIVDATEESIKEAFIEPMKPKQVGHSITIVNEWKPTPSVEVEPGKRDECDTCGHKNTTHYEGEKGHCNTMGCHCLEFK